jgi:hypothetical protein
MILFNPDLPQFRIFDRRQQSLTCHLITNIFFAPIVLVLTTFDILAKLL